MDILLKCDDFWGKDWKIEKQFFDLILKYKIKISFGIIGYGFEKTNNETVEYLKSHADFIQPFSHSYWHNLGDQLKEFYNSSKNYQIKSIYNNQKTVEKRLGYVMTTIGFPSNACDDTTLEILRQNFPYLENIYYTKLAHNREEIDKLGKKIINVDSGRVFQIHPFNNSFSLVSFEQFILDQLKQGNNFIFPNEYE